MTTFNLKKLKLADKQAITDYLLNAGLIGWTCKDLDSGETVGLFDNKLAVGSDTAMRIIDQCF